MTRNWQALGEVLTDCLERGLTFCAYRVPGGSVELLVQRAPATGSADATTLDDEVDVFLIAPFYLPHTGPLVLRPDQRLSFSATDNGGTTGIPSDFLGSAPVLDDRGASMDRAAHGATLAAAKAAISRGELRKVVISRTKRVPFQREHLADLFIASLSEHGHAFACLLNAPSVGTWIGASPERLLAYSEGSVVVDAIAGTLPRAHAPVDATAWGEKEQDEQRSVTDHIVAVLKHVQPVPIEVVGPEVLHAGQVAHLHTRISTELNGRSLASCALALHPTPAVCGIPTAQARTFIHAYEPHERGLYAGFWGPWRTQGRTLLHVNIRCMQVFLTHALIHVGGGITAGSVAEKEWEETEQKALTWETLVRRTAGPIS